jgi:hypothetical protein
LLARRQWLTPVIIATQEADIRRKAVQSQPRQIVHKTLSQKNPITKSWTCGMAQGEGPEFKPPKKIVGKVKAQVSEAVL